MKHPSDAAHGTPATVSTDVVPPVRRSGAAAAAVGWRQVLSKLRLAWLMGPLLLFACATSGPDALQRGESLDTVRSRLGPPAAEFAEPGGGTRLEYSTGTFGRRTYMLDFDPAGRLLRSENVRTASHFADVRPGMTVAELRRRLGSPSRTWAVRYHDQQVWSYRFETPFCQLFHVGLTPAGLVEDTSFGPDPLCDDDDRPRLRR